MQRNCTYSRAYPCKCLTFGCLATTAFDQTRYNIYIYIYVYMRAISDISEPSLEISPVSFITVRNRHHHRHQPSLCSSGHSSWFRTRGAQVRFPTLPDFLGINGSGTGSTQPCKDNWGSIERKYSGSGLKNRDWMPWRSAVLTMRHPSTRESWP
jgi:hypothetical protein